jgi:tetratricopeptide (TPR) repeat protein
MLRLVFLGNCQMLALQHMYTRFVAPCVPSRTTYIATHGELSNASRMALGEADVIVRQVLNFTVNSNDVGFGVGVKVYTVPVVTGGFLWPFSGRAHPLNAPTPGLKDGPYPGQLGDSYLNNLIASGIEPEVAAKQYSELDLSMIVDLDRLYEIAISKQRRLDGDLGYSVTDLIEQNLQHQSMFLTSFHPQACIINHLAIMLFRKMDIAEVVVARVERMQKRAFGPNTELPIHPSVARHFKLDFISSDQKYRSLDGGFVKFQDWAARYMRFEWNEPLIVGMAMMTEAKNDSCARLKLQEGLSRSPDSALGWHSLALLSERQGDREKAIDAARRSIKEDPNIPECHHMLGNLLSSEGLHDQSVSEFDQAAKLDPANAHFHTRLADALSRAGQLGRAISAVRGAMAIEPQSGPLLIRLGHLLSAASNPLEAEAAFQQAIEVDPSDPHAHQALSVLLSLQNRHSEALESARRAVDLAPEQAALHALVGRVHSKTPDLIEAEAAFRSAIRLDHDNAEYHHWLSLVLARLGRNDEALSAVRNAICLEPNKAVLYAHLRAMLARTVLRDTVVESLSIPPGV